MNTTLDLPDDLIHAIEHRAASSGSDFQETLTSLLREALELKSASENTLAPAVLKSHPITGLPYLEFPHAAVEELTPQLVSDILLQQEVDWTR